VEPLGQLPALQLLTLHSNPITAMPGSPVGKPMVGPSGTAGAAGICWFPELTELDLSHTQVSSVHELLPIRLLLKLQLLHLVGTPLARRSCIKDGSHQVRKAATSLIVYVLC